MNYKNISPKEAKRELEQNKDIILLDVRTKEEYEEKHIPNSILIPVDEINKNNDKIANKIKNKESKIFVYCRVGRRSKIAAEKLANLGYKNVYNIEGGITSWKYETE